MQKPKSYYKMVRLTIPRWERLREEKKRRKKKSIDELLGELL